MEKENYNIKLNLAALKKTGVREIPKKDGSGSIRCVVIPVEENNIFVSEKGNIFLSLDAWSTDSQYSTHRIRRTLTKAEREQMSKDEKNAMWCGDMKPINYNGNNNGGYKQNNTTQTTPNSYDDIPF